MSLASNPVPHTQRGCAGRLLLLCGAASVLLLALASSLAASALDASAPLAAYARQSWMMENGLPQNTVQALAQTRDGFLWLGTEVGLVRFDGTAFALFDQHTRPALPGADVRCLLAEPDGSLWIGTSDGLARLKDGALEIFTRSNGLPSNAIRSLLRTGDTLWVLTESGLARLEGSRFVSPDLPGGLHGSDVTAAATEGAGEAALWVTTPRGTLLYQDGRWTLPGARAGRDAALPPDGVLLAAHYGNGSLALAGNSSLVLEPLDRPSERLMAGVQLPGSRIQALFGDRGGALWIGTNNGLVRWTGHGVERLPATDPLSAASVLSLFEDQEGDLWAGTESNGLHILREQRFRSLTTRDGLASDDATAIVQDGRGAVWVGTRGSGVTELPPAGAPPRHFTVRQGLISDVILSLAAAPGGDLWVGTPDGLSRIGGSGVESFTSADGLPDDFIRSLLADADGSLWIGTRRGLAHWMRPRPNAIAGLTSYTTANGLGSDLVGAMARDAAGDLWVATFAGLTRFHGGRLTNYTTVDGLSSNVITALLPTPDGSLLVGTQDHGWNVRTGGRFLPGVAPAGAHPSIRAILNDTLGHLWFATGVGIARCDAPAGGNWAACAHWMEFGSADGLRSRETAANSHPSAWRTREGQLWFATPRGVVVVDPAHFRVNAVPPPLAVERFAVDDVDQPLHAPGELTLPAGHNHLQFDYAAMSFAAPQKVRYRYMLSGFDRDWTDAGSRRTAYYTNIPPGTYTFRVQAANNDGVWNTRGAALAFRLRPHFYQTVWFYLALGVLVAALVFLLLRLRLLHAEREFKAVLGERNRIAREIHDTLAQGYVGISVQLEVLSELLRHKKVEAAAKHLDTTRVYVRQGLDDARQSIWALRSQDSGETTLPVRMRRLAEQAGDRGLEARFSLYGAYRPLPAGTEREFLRVAQESIHNVKKHAGATMLMVQLAYSAAEIALEVRDNGCGFETGAQQSGPDAARGGRPAGEEGHYGLTGMRERAETLGGTLEVVSKPGEGTTIRLRVPARKAAKE